LTPIEAAVAALGSGPLEEALLRRYIDPLFSRILKSERKGGTTYLANHSLGRPLDATADDLAQASALWYGSMDDAWDAWLAEQRRFRSRVSRLIGLSREDAVVPKTSAGQGLRAVLNSFPVDRPLRVVTTTGEFDSIDFILKTYACLGRAVVEFVGPARKSGPVPIYDAERIAVSVRKGCDLVVVSQVFFTTGQVLEGLQWLVQEAHSQGALVLVDTYHSAGVIPVGFDRNGFDFAVGGCYKYLRGGPGACFLAVNPRHLDSGRRTLDTGWFAKKGTFSYERKDSPELSPGGDAWLESTPPVLTAFQARAGLEFTIALGVDRIRRHSLMTLNKLRQACPNLFAPEDPEAMGAFAVWPVDDTSNAVSFLRSRGVRADGRGGFVRLCPDVLTSEEDIDRASRAVAAFHQKASLQ
jgi:kynureninase